MGVKILALVLTLLVFHGVECQSPPKVDGSFIAWGEIVQPIGDELTLQISFEESYDADSKNAAFFLWFGGHNVTFIKTENPSQTFMYIETDKKKKECTETSETEWVESDFESSLLGFEDDEGKVKFSLNQLFDLPEKYLSAKGRGVHTVYRDIPALSWTYEYESKDESGSKTTLTITSYWASGTFDTSAGRYMAPLGFNLSKLSWTKPVVVANYIINVYGFVPNAYDHKYFRAVEGIVCSTRQQSLKFPNVKQIKAISLRSEIALPDYQELRYFDTYFDTVNKLLRVDIERMKDEDPMERKFKKYQSEVALGRMGVVYRYGYFKGESSCEVVPFDKYQNDMQNLFDITQTQWNVGKLFGINYTSYIYIGKTTKNDIPCHVFQGTRKDWPDAASGVESLWEWCFNVNMSKVNDIMMFQDDEFGLVSAQVKITKAKEEIYNNYRMNFHFYEVKAEDPDILNFTSFDIGKCFNDSQKIGLQFFVDVTLDHNTKLLAENVTSDIVFLQKWKTAIYQHSFLEDYSMRVSDVRSTIEGDRMFVKFYILGIHEDIPGETKRGMLSLSEAEKNLRDGIDAGLMRINHEWKPGQLVMYSARKNSLEYQIDPDVKPQTLPPIVDTTSTVSTLIPFTLITGKPVTGTRSSTTLKTNEPTISTKSPFVSTSDTPPTDTGSTSDTPPTGTGSTSTPTIPPSDKPIQQRIQKFTGNQPGAVAGVSIAMLLVGVSIGSSATFYKFNGLPRFLRR